MNDVPSYLKRAADKIGFVRSRYDESRMPMHPQDICVMVFFGDMRSTFVLSSILLKRFREQVKGSKYFILCSWPGYDGLFPYVDEYWAIRDESVLDQFYRGSSGFHNLSEYEFSFRRSLNWFFEDVIDASSIEPYYNSGITHEFWERFKHIKRTLPSVPSIGIMGPGFINEFKSKPGDKVVIYPVRFMQHWRNGNLTYLRCDRSFWKRLVERLVAENITPVVYQNFSTYDMSTNFANQCIYVAEKDVSKILGVMRHTGCVIDIFSGISRLAIAARTPFIACDERSRYVGLKEYEIDDLCCGKELPREYIFTFPTIINRGIEDLWEINFFDGIVAKLKSLLTDINRDALPSTSECTVVVPYENVRKRKVLRLGTKFIKIERG
jgi:hypothetical protein